MNVFGNAVRSRLQRAHRAAYLSGLLLSVLAGCGGTGSQLGTDSTTRASKATDCTDLTGTAQVVCYASAFKATLSTAQQSAVQLEFTKTTAVNWSNLPVNSSSRNGLTYANLTTVQQNAALAVAQAALGTAGYSTYDGIRKADDYLSANSSSGGTGGGPGGGPGGPPGGGGGGGNYGSGLYNIAFLGTPSTSSTWELQLTGHHYALNMVYKGSPVSPTPNFVGVEPQSFVVNGTTYAPVQTRRNAMYNMINSLDTTQLATAKLSASFSDVLLGPGQDGKFPAHQGILYSALTTAQQALVKIAIEAWVKDTPPILSNKLLADYESSASLAQTYIAYSGTTTFNNQGDYVRIDGPRVWIEFVCQNGVVFPTMIHFHTIWRDRTADYGGSFSF